MDKTGERFSFKNHKGISLVNLRSEMLASIILHRLSIVRKTCIYEKQSSFRHGLGYTEQNFHFTKVLEQTKISLSWFESRLRLSHWCISMALPLVRRRDKEIHFTFLICVCEQPKLTSCLRRPLTWAHFEGCPLTTFNDFRNRPILMEE